MSETIFAKKISTPLGNVLVTEKKEAICGLWFFGQKYFPKEALPYFVFTDTKILSLTEDWLSIYFSGVNPHYRPPLSPEGSFFQNIVWNLLLDIPFGTTTTYGMLSKKVAEITSKEKISPQAIGNAVGHNPISILIPCHRVVQANGQLCGYAGGIDRKRFLLVNEGVSNQYLSYP